MFEVIFLKEKESGYFSYEIFMNWKNSRIKIFSIEKKPRFKLKNKEMTTQVVK